MAKSAARRLPEVKSLYEILPKGTEGGKEFARIVDLLLFHEARRNETQTTLFSDAAGDYKGLDSLTGDSFFKKDGVFGYQYKFYPSPLSDAHRKEIEDALIKASRNQKSLRLKKWILVTPMDFVESSQRKTGGDVTWFNSLTEKYELRIPIEHWGHSHLISLFLQAPYLALFHYPELVRSGGARRRTIEDTHNRYRNALDVLYNDIQFVGMSVYEQEAARGVAIKDIYIPLKVVPETVLSSDEFTNRLDTTILTAIGTRHVVLGDPGSGKSTLLRFLALAGHHKELQQRYNVQPDNRLPIIVTLRKYADELKANPNLSLIDYVIEDAQADLSIRSADLDFFEYFLESGEAILLFDGLDELPNSSFKNTVRNRIRTFISNYPGNTVVVTSRIVGYDEPFSFSRKDFLHTRVALLELPEIEQFVSDWYSARIDNQAEMKRNVEDLLRIVRDEDHVAIKELASNPLLLTIVTLVHRIDAILPDERVVLYQKCTETLLNTWHTWKFKEAEQKNRGRVERRNRARMEAIAHWMQSRSVDAHRNARTVAPYDDIHQFLTSYIVSNENLSITDMDPQDAAADFLEFVRKRAGLLVEAGDGQYSFVHLTFQEYLTSTYIITLNEAGGINGIWDTIAPHIANARWSEVIRLLIGGLRATSSQVALLDKILNAQSNHQTEEQAQIAELLGGFLLDRIEAAEAKRKVIIHDVLLAATNTKSEVMCNRLLRVVRAWSNKDYYDEVLVTSIFSGEACPDLSSRLLLLAPACGIEIDTLIGGARWNDLDLRDQAILKLLFSNEIFDVSNNAELSQELQHLYDVTALCAITAPHSNLAASRLQSIFFRLKPEVAAEYLFYLQLASLIGGTGGGPYRDFTANSFGYHLDEFTDRPSRERRKIGPIGVKKNVGRRDNVLGLAISEVETSLGATREPIGESSFWLGRGVLSRRVSSSFGADFRSRISNVQNRRIRSKQHNSTGNLPSDIGSLITEIISRVLDLSPSPQWGDSLAFRFTPFTDKLLWTRDPIRLQKIVRLAARRSSSPYLKGWIILIAAWHRMFDVNLPFDIEQVLSSTASTVDEPVEIAKTIFKLAEGDASNVRRLVEYLSLPEYRFHFEKAGWVAKTNRKRKSAPTQ
jgi:hypothetical protein